MGSDQSKKRLVSPPETSSIVGNITTCSEGAWVSKKIGDQTHALGYAPRAEMPRDIEAERDEMPSSSREGA